MRVSLRLSSGLAQYAPSTRFSFDLAPDSTIADLINQLGVAYPALKKPLSTSVAVVAGRHVERGEVLNTGDEVAFLIPISGG